MGQVYEVQPNKVLSDKYPNIYIIPMIHNVDTCIPDTVPMVIINFSIDDVSISKGEIMGFLQCQSIDILEIRTEISAEPSPIGIGEDNVKEVSPNQKEKKFITSPTDIDVHRKVILQRCQCIRRTSKCFQRIMS